MPRFPFEHTYARDLPGLYLPAQAAPASAPRLLFLNAELADELGLALAGEPEAALAALFSGQALPEGAQAIAQAYAGHQFGGFSPQLGDGRALLLGELIDRHGRRRDIAFKGSGRTPFSRGGDGKAAVGPMLREVLIGEAMHALHVPTTRALAVAATGDTVVRDRPLPGAVLTRVAASHLRVGSFQYPAARGDRALLAKLLDHAIARHDPALDDPALAGTPQRIAGLLAAVARRQAALMAQWMNLGFIHGVMNTDNMTISGETIDYGPCAFLEAYDPATVFSSIDHGGRYAFGRQPAIARWNLARLAEALLPLLIDGEAPDDAAVEAAATPLKAVIDDFPLWYEAAWRSGQRAKLGLQQAEDGDAVLADDWLVLLQQHRVDHTLAWRRLGNAAAGDATPLHALFAEADAVNPWLARWHTRCTREDAGQTGGTAARAARMRQVNPWVIPRNHRVEEALAAATEAGDVAPFQRLLAALRQPWAESAAAAPYAEPAPAALTAGYQTFCGT